MLLCSTISLPQFFLTEVVIMRNAYSYRHSQNPIQLAPHGIISFLLIRGCFKLVAYNCYESMISEMHIFVTCFYTIFTFASELN